MIRTAGLLRVGLGEPLTERDSDLDPRIHVDLGHLRRLQDQAKALSFLRSQPARSVLNGRNASRLRGRGLNFEDLRHYLPGDDIRNIDWKVTARTGSPHIRIYTEEKDRPTLIMVDQRMSMFFGSQLNMKSVTAAEAAALFAFIVSGQGDRVGGIVFGDEIVSEFKPHRGPGALDRFITAIANANQCLNADAPIISAMELNQPLRAASRIAKRDHLIFIISDFSGVDAETKALIRSLAVHNDVIMGLVSDPLGHDLPDDFQIVASDGRLQAIIDTSGHPARTSLSEMLQGRLAEIIAWGEELNLPVLPLTSGAATVSQVRRLMGRV